MPPTPVSELQPGTLVGEYQITGKLGEGGMGVVYAGQHPEIGKRVAIKVLAPHAADRPDLIHRFKEEARAVNKIRHPNIIDIFAFNQLPDGRHYFVMEFLEGESLTARLEHGAMELAEMRRLLGQICSALQAAHQAGIVHRDLKPDNIWVAKRSVTESSIKLLDFGIAKLGDAGGLHATQAGVAMGTPHYMPPEQGMGRAIDARTDIYALGVVLYQIFAGTVPFDGVTAHEIVMKHVSDAPLPPSRHRPIVPPGMEAIILDCLQKQPDRRPPSIEVLWQRIDAAFGAEMTAAKGAPSVVPRLPTASPPPAIGPATSLSGMSGDLGLDVPKRSRRPLVIAIGAAVAVAGLGATLILRHPAPVADGPPEPAAVPAPGVSTEAPGPAPTPAPDVAPAAAKPARPARPAATASPPPTSPPPLVPGTTPPPAVTPPAPAATVPPPPAAQPAAPPPSAPEAGTAVTPPPPMVPPPAVTPSAVPPARWRRGPTSPSERLRPGERRFRRRDNPNTGSE
jgi:serine/threonine-protein kinase